jgi:FAD/FMN-containing dehydrogenase
VRPSDPDWPKAALWEKLGKETGGRLIEVKSPLQSCISDPASTACDHLFSEDLSNPYMIGDSVALTQTLGWVDAWTSQPSAYAVAAESAHDVAAAVNFAREHRLRLVVKGGGHSYHGTSNAPDSLLVWTRRMHQVGLQEAFVGQGCRGQMAPQPAITLGAGAIWMQAYEAATTQGGRYVQGGGCTTVGVAGLVQSGGFGSFSKAFGTAAAGLLEAEIVTADGTFRVANACTNPDLFWALKGGGGGNFGVITQLTLRTHELPEFFGGVFATIEAKSDAAFQRLIAHVIAFYSLHLFNPHWGEQLVFGSGNKLSIRMVFQGLGQREAEELWEPLFRWVQSASQDFKMANPVVLAIPAGHFWDPEFLKKLPGLVRFDDRANAAPGNMFWAGDAGQVGQYLHGYYSTWLPASLLRADRQQSLAAALFAATRSWQIELHFNKGLAGGTDEALASTSATAMNPSVIEAFALAICAGGEDSAYPGIAGHEPHVAEARKDRSALQSATEALRKVAPASGCYLAESDFFEHDWRNAHWGTNYARLLAVKEKYDPEGLFTVHHAVGSDRWSPDGFTRLS